MTKYLLIACLAPPTVLAVAVFLGWLRSVMTHTEKWNITRFDERK